MRFWLEFKLEDLWIGAFFRANQSDRRWHLWICLLPCLPLHLTWPMFWADRIWTTRTQIAAFKRAQESLHADLRGGLLYRAEVDAVESVLCDLYQELEELTEWGYGKP